MRKHNISSSAPRAIMAVVHHPAVAVLSVSESARQVHQDRHGSAYTGNKVTN